MADNNPKQHNPQRVQNGYTPKGIVTKVEGGKTVQVPVAQVKVIPPPGGTAAVTPKKN